MQFRRILKLLVTAGAIVIIALFFFFGLDFFKKMFPPGIGIEIPKMPKEKIFTPGPLTFPTFKKTEIPLSNEEIIKFTNYYRKENQQEELKINENLMRAAEIKLEDMFKKQYFAHISPEGKGAGDILEGVGYKYLIVGENLAMGYFKDSKELVDGWIESPGHLENILNPKFKEIGVAQKKDFFQGKEQYLAVQIFAAPQSLCPLPEETLFSKIENKKEELERLTKEAEDLKTKIDKKISSGIDSQEETEELQTEIEKYNIFVNKINNLSKEIKKLTLNYNLQVTTFNHCIDTFLKTK